MAENDDSTREEQFQKFLEERSGIFEDIESFLDAVLSFCLNQEDDWNNRVQLDNVTSWKLLLKSLCQIHGLYGYPKNKDINTEVNKHAVRNMLSEIKEKNEETEGNNNEERRTLLSYCGRAATDEFYPESLIENNITVHREPAHIFLQMMREVLGDGEEARKIGRNVLETLPDGNFLKPVMWAEVKEDKNKPECFGVSLAVRSFVRPLYLGIKLTQLRNVENGNNDVELEDVNAFQSMNRYDQEHYDPIATSEYKKGEEGEEGEEGEIKPPCDSCKIFFGDGSEVNEENFTYFGNCAEYDIIPTANTDINIGEIKQGDHWKTFEKAYNRHMTAFNVLAKELDLGGAGSAMETYYRNTRSTIVLRYKKDKSEGSGCYLLKSTKRSHAVKLT